jgi:hypothetical protein
MRVLNTLKREISIWSKAIATDRAAFFGLLCGTAAWIGSGYYLWNKLPVEANGFFSFAMGQLVDRTISWYIRTRESIKNNI